MRTLALARRWRQSGVRASQGVSAHAGHALNGHGRVVGTGRVVDLPADVAEERLARGGHLEAVVRVVGVD